MRVLHVNKFLYRRGGAEAYMLDVAALQTGDGHETAFFGMAHPENGVHRFEDYFPREIELEPAPRSVVARLGAAGRVLWSPAARRGMEAVLEAFRPDVVHLHNIYHHLSPSILQPLAAAGVPVVMTLHDYKLACPTYLFLAGGEPCDACLGGRFHNAVLRRCKGGSLAASSLLALESTLHTATGAYAPVRRFICPSRFSRDKMAAAGVFPQRLRLLSNFIDTSEVEAQQSPGQGIFVATRLAEEKGVDTIIRAVGRLPTRVVLLVAGEGPERGALEALAEEVAPGLVRFLGRLPRSEVLRRIREARVVAVPSRCFENQPMTILEAFACAVPVIATRLGGMAELVRHDQDGLLVPPNDVDALAEALEEFLHDDDKVLRFGQAGRQRVEAEFSPVAHLRGLERVYNEAGVSIAVSTSEAKAVGGAP